MKKKVPPPGKSDMKATASTDGKVGIDARGESVERYGNLEQEGYARHAHSDREGEYQRGGKSSSDLPVESTPARPDVRYRRDASAKERNQTTQYGGKTFDGKPGDNDAPPASGKH